MNKPLPLLSAALLGLFLAGCESLPTKDADAGQQAVVEDRSDTAGSTTVSGTDSSALEAESAAQASAISDGRPVLLDPLTDPASPLSQRVIYFDYDKTNIRAQDREVLEAHARYLADHPGSMVTLEGHTDERGSREYNVALGDRRGQSVRRMLVLLGSSNEQLRTVSYGEERPVADGHEESAWAQNRRVELIYRGL